MRTHEKEQLNRISRYAYNITELIEQLKKKNRDLLDTDLGNIQGQVDSMQEDIKYFYSDLKQGA